MDMDDKDRVESDSEEYESDCEDYDSDSDEYDSDDCYVDDYLFPMPLQRNVQISIKKDDKDKFVSLINSQLEKPKFVSLNVLLTIITFRAKECALALFNGETGQEVNLNSLIPPTGLSLLHNAISWPWLVDYLLNHHNTPTNLRCDRAGEKVDQRIPLNDALDPSYSGFVSDSTSSKPSIFKIIIRRCLPGYKPSESVRLLVKKTEKVEEEIFYYATQGKLVELATLLMVDREKVMSSSFFQKLYPSFFQTQNDPSSLSGCMSLRNFIVSKLASLAAVQVKPGYCESDNLSRICKEKEATMMSTLLLLEVFERAGEAIEAYLGLERNRKQEKQVTEEVAWLLQKAGFTLTYEDVDLRYPHRNIRGYGFAPQVIKPQLDLTQYEYILLCDQIYGQKGEKELHNKLGKYVSKNSDMAKSTTSAPYAKWRIASAQHILESTKFLLESLKEPPMISLNSDGGLLRALELLRHHPCLKNWNSKNSIFELLCILCWPEMSETLETIRLAACDTMEIGMISCHSIKDGRLIDLAALLMVAREKLIVGNTSQDGSGYGYGASIVRQFIMHEIQNLIDEEIRSLGRSPIDKSTERWKDEKAIMLSALQLVEVFESSGCVIDLYLQSKRYSEITKDKLAEDVAWLLKKTGFCLKQREFSLVDLKFFSTNMGKEQSENADMPRDIGIPLSSKLYMFPAEKMHLTGMINGPKGMSPLSSQYASTSFCSGIRSYHTFRLSECNFHLNSSLPMRSEVSRTSKRVKSQVSRFSLNKRLAIVVLAINRRVKCVGLA